MDEIEIENVEFALALFGEKPQKVLEIACGSDRYLVPMAKAGHNVMGIVIQAQWGEGYDTVHLVSIIIPNIVSEMDDEKVQELLIQEAAAALKTGGYLLIAYEYKSKSSFISFSELWICT